MTAQGSVNYEAYRAAIGRATGTLPGQAYADLAPDIRRAFDDGADAVEGWLETLPVDEDAPGNKGVKVFIVTEQRGIAVTERRYAADRFDADSSGLDIIRDDSVVAAYPGQHTWLSVCEEGAEVPDGSARALGIAKRALEDIRAQHAAGTHAHETAGAALELMWSEGEA